MGYGYALLPVADSPVSTMVFRLTPAEKKERDEWIHGAFDRGWDISVIAYEVGLSEQRVKQIVKAGSAPILKKSTISLGPRKKFKTPREAALADFMENPYHIMGGGGNCKKFDSSCMHCMGSFGMVDSEYDANGWPYSWAMYGQEKYIAQVS